MQWEVPSACLSFFFFLQQVYRTRQINKTNQKKTAAAIQQTQLFNMGLEKWPWGLVKDWSSVSSTHIRQLSDT